MCQTDKLTLLALLAIVAESVEVALLGADESDRASLALAAGNKCLIHGI